MLPMGCGGAGSVVDDPGSGPAHDRAGSVTSSGSVTGLVVALRRRNLLCARVAPGLMSPCQAASGAYDAYAGVGQAVKCGAA